MGILHVHRLRGLHLQSVLGSNQACVDDNSSVVILVLHIEMISQSVIHAQPLLKVTQLSNFE